MQIQTLAFTNENIALAVQKIKEFFAAQKVDHRTLLRTALSAEEVLLKYQKHWGEEARFTLLCVRYMGRVQAEIAVRGAPFDPFAETEADSVLHALLVNAGAEPAWACRRGSNRVVFAAQGKKKLSNLTQIVLALVFGLGLGFAAAYLPNDTGLTVSQKLLTPVSDAIMGFLSASTMLMIFLSVASGICSMGDISTFNRIGKKMIVRFLVMLLPAAVIAAAVLLPFFRVETEGTAALELSSYFEMLLGVVPDNLVEPFLTGNTLQIIFLAACFSGALLVLGLRTSAVSSLVMQAKLVSQTVVAAITKLLPVVVFISMFSLAVSHTLETAFSAYKLLGLDVLGVGVLVLADLMRVSVSGRVSPLLYLRKLAPVMAITIATASSSAALTTVLDAAEKKLGIDRQLCHVGVPLAMVVFKPYILVFYPAAILCLAEVYRVPITVGCVISLFLTSLFVSVAASPVPGGTVSCLLLMFTQFQIPVEAAAIVVALDAIIDRVNTTAKELFIAAELTQLAGSLDLLDTETLRAADGERDSKAV